MLYSDLGFIKEFILVKITWSERLWSTKGIAHDYNSFVTKMPKVYSSEDLEKFDFDYQTEWMLQGILIQTYCSRNIVPIYVIDINLNPINWLSRIHRLPYIVRTI